MTRRLGFAVVIAATFIAAYFWQADRELVRRAKGVPTRAEIRTAVSEFGAEIEAIGADVVAEWAEQS